MVEFVARRPEAFENLKKDSRVLKAFQKGKDKKEDIEKEFKKYKKDFQFDGLTLSGVPAGLPAPVAGGAR